MKHYECKTDVAIIGAGPAGLSAAISAARKGKKVLLLEKNGYIGGNAAIGLPLLGFLDAEGRQIVGGIAQEYVDALAKRGQCRGHRICPKHNSVTNIDPEGFKILGIEMCRNAGVEVILHVETTSVEVENKRIKKVILYGKGNIVSVTADVFIDCTGDGDVAYLAGCSYESGQPETGTLQPPTVMYTLENVNTKKLFDYIEKNPDEMTYSATIDHRPGYDADYFRGDENHVFVGLRQTFNRLRERGELPVERETLIYIKSLKPGEIYVNSTRLINTDATDIYDLSKAEMDGQLQCAKLTEVLRKNVSGFEDCFISHIAPCLGIRETRRFSGISRLVAEDVVGGIIPDDTICLAGYKIDIHSGTDNTTMFRNVNNPYGIPYGCLVSDEVDNLMFAGRCVSMDAASLASARVMPYCMAMGQAAGIAAAMAVTEKINPVDIDVDKLRRYLLSQGAILSMKQVKHISDD